MDLHLFDAVAVNLRALVAPDLGEPQVKAHRYGIKVWFGSAAPTREHYEAQVINARHVPEAKVLAIEVGFHAEHPKKAENIAVLAHLTAKEKAWRNVVGDEAEAGPFLGRPDDWRRVSETWPDPDLGELDLAFELAARLTDYITALEPLLRARTP
ncbi:MAG: hypothetical protein WD691_02240 [Acidimicrobiales bacterium]